jgi:hypothetical protein
VIEKDIKKENHRKSMRLVAALALEHGLRFLPPKHAVRKLVEKDITIVRHGDEFEIKARHTQAKKRPVNYTPEGLMLQGARALLFLAKHKGYPSHGLLKNVCYFPTEAGFLSSKSNDGRAEQHAEWEWQDKNIQPLVEQIFQSWGEPLEIPAQSAKEAKWTSRKFASLIQR